MKKRHFMALNLLIFFMNPLLTAQTTAVLDISETRQTIEGFGTCLISWGKTSRSDFYNDEMARIYSEELGLNMLRVNVAPWGYPKTENPNDIRWDKIDLNHPENSRVGVFIDFAQKLKKFNPDLRIIGTVWSPPAWMKVNDNITGGNPRKGEKTEPSINGDDYQKSDKVSKNRMKKEYYPHFTKLLTEMCRLHEKKGVPFYAMSPGNEVMFSQSFESCVWTAEDFATIVGMLGDSLEREGYGDVRIFGPETMTGHNWSIANPLYIQELKKNKTAWRHFDVFATHGYTDGFTEDMSAESSLEYWNMIEEYDKPLWMTEGGTGSHDWPGALNGAAAAVYNSLVAGNASAWVPWQVASGGGDKNTHALMAGDQMTKKTYAVMHFTRWIDADAQRIHVDNDNPSLRVTAFGHRGNRQLSIVVLNPSNKSQTLDLELKGTSPRAFNAYRTSASENHATLNPVPVAGGKLTLTLPKESIVTLVTGG